MNEKSPIDDLFARKLRGAEVQPSADAWARLQAKQAGQSRPLRRIVPLWYYTSAAACLLLVGIGAWLWWQSQPTSALTGPVVAKQTNKPSQQITSDLHNSPVSEPKTVQPALPTMVLPHGVEANSQIATTNRQQKSPRSLPKALPTLESQPAELVHIAIQQPELPLSKPQTVLVEPAETKPVAPIAVPSAERTLIVSIAAPVQQTPVLAEEQSTEPKAGEKPGFGKFLNKLKRLKNGEAFARNDTRNEDAPTASGNRLSRIYNDVKESLKNIDTNN